MSHILVMPCFFAKLALVEGELLLTVSEEYFNIPAFCVDIENFQ